MKIYFTLFALITAISISAQPVWDSTDEPSVGDSVFYYLLDSNVTNFTGITGANVSWDYSTVSTYSFDDLKKAKADAASQSPYFNFYSSASHDNYIEDHLHNFNSLNSSARSSYGIQVYEPNQGDLLVTYDGYIDRNYPWTYMSQVSASLTNGKVVLYPNSTNPPQVKYNSGGTYSSLVDGYGSLTIGDTVVVDVLRNIREDSIRADLSVAGKATLIRSQYEYFAPGMSFPVFVHSHVKIYGAIINIEYSLVLSQIQPKISMGIAEKSNVSFEFTIHPNPTSGTVKIETAPWNEISGINVFDVSGSIQNIPSTFNNSSVQIDISELAEGVYIIQVTSDNGQLFTKRLVKSGR